MSVPPERVSIKVTTTDYLGFIGRAEGIAACAVASIVLPAHPTRVTEA